MTNPTFSFVPFKGNWTAQKARLKAKITLLLDGDLSLESIKKEKFLSNLKEKTGKTKEEILYVIKNL